MQGVPGNASPFPPAGEQISGVGVALQQPVQQVLANMSQGCPVAVQVIAPAARGATIDTTRGKAKPRPSIPIATRRESLGVVATGV